MSNVYLRGLIYHYKFTFNDILYRGSCKTSDPAIAKMVYQDEYKKVMLGDRGLRKVPTLAAMASMWLDHFANQYSKSHLTTGKVFFDCYLIPAFGKYQLDKIDKEKWANAFKTFTATKSPATYNSLIKYFNILNNYAVELGYLTSVKFKPKKLKEQQKNKPIVTLNTLSEFLRQSKILYKSPQVHMMLEMGLYTGMRESEIIHATWSNFNEEYALYTVAPSETKTATKSHKTRAVELPASLVASLIAYRDAHGKLNNDLMFPSRDGNPHCMSYLTAALYALSKRMGIEKLSSHRLRASFITNHHELGTPMVAIQGMVGHEDLETTSRYLTDSRETRIVAQAKLSRLALS